MAWMQSCHLSAIIDVRTRFYTAPILKILTTSHKILNVIPTDIWTLYFFFLNCANTSVYSKFNSFAFLTSAGKTVTTAGSDTNRGSTKIPSQFAGLPAMHEDDILIFLTLVFRCVCHGSTSGSGQTSRWGSRIKSIY